MSDLSITQLIFGASPVVQIVMAFLLLFSMVSWLLIFNRWRVIRQANKVAEEFEAKFWEGTELSALYRQVTRKSHAAAGIEVIFKDGYAEFARLNQQGHLDFDRVIDGVRLKMQVAASREIDELSRHLSLLATAGSTSPYIGLFGTVWGIMGSFRSLGNVKQATLSAVAPGIAEALIATALGLVVAIPAVMAYNRFANSLEIFSNRYYAFIDEFTVILYRHAPDE